LVNEKVGVDPDVWTLETEAVCSVVPPTTALTVMVYVVDAARPLIVTGLEDAVLVAPAAAGLYVMVYETPVPTPPDHEREHPVDVTEPAVKLVMGVTGTWVVIEADVADPDPSSTVPVTVTVVLIDAVDDSVNVVVFVPLDDVVFADVIVAVADDTESA